MRTRPENFKEHIAVFGGAFDPPHLSHVDAAKALLKNPGVKSVIVMPSWGTPLKSSTTPYETRLEMTRIAFAGIDPRIEVSNLEAEIQSQYTWQVLEKLRSIYSKIAFVIGTDQLAKLEQWNRFPEVLELCDWIVLERAGHEDRRTLPEHMVRIHTPAKAISSTQVRELLAMNRFEDLKTVLPRSVREYVERKRVY